MYCSSGSMLQEHFFVCKKPEADASAHTELMKRVADASPLFPPSPLISPYFAISSYLTYKVLPGPLSSTPPPPAPAPSKHAKHKRNPPNAIQIEDWR